MGRPLADIKLNLDDLPDLEPLLAEVLDTVSTKERDVQDKHGRWYSLRLRPYRTLENKIDGVVVMLVDVDSLKRAHAYTESIVATVREPLLVLDADLRVRTASARSTRPSASRPRKRSIGLSTSSATASGTSPSCAGCSRSMLDE